MLERVLIIGPAWVGDMVMAQSLFKLLREQHPHLQLDVLAPPITAPLLSRMPEVQTTISAQLSHGKLDLKKRYRLGKKLRENRYQTAIVIPNSLKSALIPYWAQIPNRIGWLGEYRFGLLTDWRYLDKKKYPLMLERLLALGNKKNGVLPPQKKIYPQLIVTENQINSTLQQLGLTLSPKPLLILCPGAEYGPAKRWPPEYFAQVANTKLNEGWQVWILGSQKEAPLAAHISLLTHSACHDLTGKTTLTEAIDLLSLANLVITNDSGLMHVAAALNRKLIVIYGASSRYFTPPLTETVLALSLDLSCSPCFKRECPLKHYRCLKDLTPDFVNAAIRAKGW